MALGTNELFSSATQDPFPRIKPVHVFSKTISAITGGPELGVGFPLAFNTSTNKWVPWTTGGVNGTGTIRAFVYPDAIQSDATDDVLGQIMIAGDIHHDDVLVPSGETQNNLTIALKAGLSERGLYVTGIAAAY